MTYWLYAYDGGQAVAWSDHARDYFSARGGAPFGWRESDWLYAYGTGNPIGYFDSGTLYSPTGDLLCWEDPPAPETPPGR